MMVSGYPELLEDLWGKLAEVLAEGGVDAPAAREAAFLVTEYIRTEWGGRWHYQPKGKPRAAGGEPADAGLFDPAEVKSVKIDDVCLAALRQRTAAILGGLGRGGGGDLPDVVTELVRTAWAGERVYVPKGQSFDLRRRDYEIWRQWDGTWRTRRALSRKYNLTEMRLYQIIDKVRRMERERTHPKLPGVEG